MWKTLLGPCVLGHCIIPVQIGLPRHRSTGAEILILSRKSDAIKFEQIPLLQLSLCWVSHLIRSVVETLHNGQERGNET